MKKTSLIKLIYCYLIVIPKKLRMYNRYLKEETIDGYDRYYIYRINFLTKQRKQIKKEIIKKLT